MDERSDPEKATRAAARYLRELYELFGDWNLALASYNAGEGRVSRAMERYGANDFWTLSRVSNLAQETRNYVPMIHAAIIVAKAADKYGFDVAPEPVLTYDTVPVKGAVDLRVIAECAGTGVQHRAVAQPRAAAAGHAREPHLPGEGAAGQGAGPRRLPGDPARREARRLPHPRRRPGPEPRVHRQAVRRPDRGDRVRQQPRLRQAAGQGHRADHPRQGRRGP